MKEFFAVIRKDRSKSEVLSGDIKAAIVVFYNDNDYRSYLHRIQDTWWTLAKLDNSEVGQVLGEEWKIVHGEEGDENRYAVKASYA